MTIALAAMAMLVGVLIGAAGVGGILLIPALNVLAHLPIQVAMGTALFTFVFTGLVGTWSFQRRGSIDWAVTWPVCIGGALFGAAGAWANARMDARALTLILAVLIVLAGFYTLGSGAGRTTACLRDHPRRQRLLLFVIGALTGFGSGLTGVGGPVLSVPMLVLCGFAPLQAIGTSQVIQILASVSGSAGHLAHGTVDLALAAPLALIEVVGVGLGVRLAHAVEARMLRRAVGVLCVLVGAALILRAP